VSPPDPPDPPTADPVDDAPAVQPDIPPPPPAAGLLPTDDLVLPPGFIAYRWATDFFQPTVLDFASDGRLFVAERFGRVWVVWDADADGIAEQRTLFAEGLDEPLTGLLVVDEATVIVSDRTRLLRLEDRDGDGVAETTTTILGALPFGLHHSNGMVLGPDGLLYFTIGSTCNECVELDPLSATIQALDLESGALQTVATGLRNPYDLVFTPDGQLWATDNGSDPPCPTPDELNRITATRHYGWPYCEPDPRFPNSEPAAFEFALHSSADGIVWLDLPSFPGEWRDGFYVALFGTGAAGAPQTGKKVQFVQLGADGDLRARDFALGFENPLDISLGADGALYIADFGNGTIYRVFPPGRPE